MGFKEELRFEVVYDVACGIGKLAQRELQVLALTLTLARASWRKPSRQPPLLGGGERVARGGRVGLRRLLLPQPSSPPATSTPPAPRYHPLLPSLRAPHAAAR